MTARAVRAHIKGDVLTLGEVYESAELMTPRPTEVYVSPFTMAKFINSLPEGIERPDGVAFTPTQFLAGALHLDWFTSIDVPNDAYELRWGSHESD